ncbi:MAG: PKD domain-containing protein [Thermoplasmata archaeon]
MYRLDINTTPGNVTLAKPYDDGFDVGELDQRWRWLNPPAPYDVGNQVPGHLRVVASSNTTFWGSQTNGSLLWQNMSGGYGWRVITRLTSAPSHPLQRAGIVVFTRSIEWIEFSYGMLPEGPGIIRVSTTGGVSTQVNTSLSNVSVWLQIEKIGSGTWRFHYSVNGENWTLFSAANLSKTFSGSPPLQVGLAVMDGNSGRGHTADFDFFWTDQYYPNGYMTSPVMRFGGVVQSAALMWNFSIPRTGFNVTIGARLASGQQTFSQLSNGAPLNFTGEDSSLIYNVSFVAPTSAPNGTPVLTDISGDVTVWHNPENCSVDIGADGTAEWRLNGTLGAAPCRVCFTDALSAAVEAAKSDAQGLVEIPIRVRSKAKGVVQLSNLTIAYVFNSPPLAPNLLSPENCIYITTPTPTFTLRTTDPDGGTIWFELEVYYKGATAPIHRTHQFANAAGWTAINYTSGEEASYTVPVPYKLASEKTYLWRAKANDDWAWGPWSEFMEFTVDTTPPVGLVIDDGAETSDTTSLYAILAFTDEESWVIKYEYGLGTSKNSPSIVPFTETSESSVTVRNLTLIYVLKYYFIARAMNGTGLWSDYVTSDGFSLRRGAVNYPPRVSINHLAEGETLSGMVTISGNASDIEFLDTITVFVQIDGGEWLEADVNQSCSLRIDTTCFDDGPYKIIARAWDGKSYSELAMGNVSFRNRYGIELVSVEPAARIQLAENSSLTFAIEVRDPLKRPLEYRWLLDGALRAGEEGSSFTFQPSYTDAGEHNVTVSMHTTGAELNYTWIVTVLNQNRPPSACISLPIHQERFRVRENVTFDATGSSDPDPDDNLSYHWEFGDGTGADGPRATHKYLKAGKYIVTLRVSDFYTSDNQTVEIRILERSVATTGWFSDYGPLVGAAVLLLLCLTLVLAVLGWGRFERARGRAPEGGAQLPLSPAGEVHTALSPVEHRGVALSPVERKAVRTTGAMGFVVEEVFLVYRDGRLIAHDTRRISPRVPELLIGMLTAIQHFVKESLAEEGELGSLQYGDVEIILERGKKIFLAVVVKGHPPGEYREIMRDVLRNIEAQYSALVETWDGVLAPFTGVKKMLLPLFDAVSELAPPSRKETIEMHSAVEFFQGYIRVKVAVRNASSSVITGVEFEPIYDENVFRLVKVEPEYPMKKGKFDFGLVNPGVKKRLRSIWSH